MTVFNQGLQLRRFPLTMELRDVAGNGDGRTVYGRIVPYGEIASFVDEDGTVRRERFIKGALARQSRAWHLVAFAFEHERGFQNTLGYGRTLEELDDGAYASFRLYERDASKTREMLNDSHRGLSLEFYGKNDRLDGEGVIERHRVHVERVAMCMDPAYDGARVLAVREAMTPVETPNLDAVLADLEALRQAPRGIEKYVSNVDAEREKYYAEHPEQRQIDELMDAAKEGQGRR